MVSKSSNEDLELEILFLDGRAEVALRGELDIATASLVHEHLSELVTLGWIDITLDIAELRYIDSTGISLFVMAQRRAEDLGGSLVVRYPPKAALKLFDTPDSRRGSWAVAALTS